MDKHPVTMPREIMSKGDAIRHANKQSRQGKNTSCDILDHLHHKPTKLSQVSCSLTTSAAVLLEMASFSLKTGTTFMLNKSSVVADRFLRKSASAKSLLVTRICAAWQSIRPKRESYRAMSPLCPAAAAARPAPHHRLTVYCALNLICICVSVAVSFLHEAAHA